MTKPEFICRERTVLVSGAGRGLGAAFCEVFASLGANLGLIDLDAESLESTCERLRASGTRCHAVRASVADSDAVLAAVREIESELGPVHTLVNNAGITHIQNFHAEQVARAKAVVDVNLVGAINLTGACFDSIRSQAGAIVAVSSVAGYAPLVGRTAYAASKHGLHGFFDTLRLELRDEPVNVLLACPSFIATDIRRDQQTAESTEDGRSRTVGKDMSPHYVASAIVSALQAGKTEVQVGRIAIFVTVGPAFGTAFVRAFDAATNQRRTLILANIGNIDKLLIFQDSTLRGADHAEQDAFHRTSVQPFTYGGNG